MAARHIIEEIGATRPGMANLTRAVLSYAPGEGRLAQVSFSVKS
jgi:hypothetical protein